MDGDSVSGSATLCMILARAVGRLHSHISYSASLERIPLDSKIWFFVRSTRELSIVSEIP